MPVRVRALPLPAPMPEPVPPRSSEWSRIRRESLQPHIESCYLAQQLHSWGAAMVNEQVLDERLTLLEAARPWSPRVITKLEGHIRTADDEALFRINPLTFAH